VAKPGEGVATKPKTELRPPPMFKVLLHNDDYTTMDFVVSVLQSVFHKPVEKAIRIMLEVHQVGIGIAGVYTAEVAETKIDTVHAFAEESGFPLRCSMEPE